MKNLKTIQSILTVFAFAMIFAVSCTKDNSVVTEANAPLLSIANNQIANDIVVNNGILEFNTMKDFQGTIIALNRMSQEEVANWENNLGFASANTTFRNIIAAEYDATDRTDLYKKGIADGIIVELEDGTYELNTFSSAYATVLNDDFKVSIAGDLYQYTNNSIKVWKNGEMTEIAIQKQEVALRGGGDDNENFQFIECADSSPSSDPTVGDSNLETVVEFYSFIEDEEPTVGSSNDKDILFIEMTLVSKTFFNSPTGPKFDKESETRGFYAYKVGMRYELEKNSKEPITEFLEDKGSFEKTGGFVSVVMSIAGEYDAPKDATWVGPARMLAFEAKVETKTGDKKVKLGCQLAK